VLYQITDNDTFAGFVECNIRIVPIHAVTIDNALFGSADFKNAPLSAIKKLGKLVDSGEFFKLHHRLMMNDF